MAIGAVEVNVAEQQCDCFPSKYTMCIWNLAYVEEGKDDLQTCFLFPQPGVYVNPLVAMQVLAAECGANRLILFSS